LYFVTRKLSVSFSCAASVIEITTSTLDDLILELLSLMNGCHANASINVENTSSSTVAHQVRTKSLRIYMKKKTRTVEFR
jgi:hypothetical protein